MPERGTLAALAVVALVTASTAAGRVRDPWPAHCECVTGAPLQSAADWLDLRPVNCMIF